MENASISVNAAASTSYNCSVKRNENYCSICAKSFSKVSNMLKHARNVHPVQPSLISKNNQEFSCDFCNKLFCTLYNKKRHEKNMHSVVQLHQGGASKYDNSKSFKCFHCKSELSSRLAYLEHFQQKHCQIKIMTENLTLDSEADFQYWKQKLEKETVSSYIFRRSYKKGKNKVTVYECHRSGQFKGKGSGVRHMKIKGTNKTGYFCPAGIVKETAIHESGICIGIKYTATHVGHQCDLGRLTLNEAERSEIAAQLCTGIPVQRIICNLAENTTHVDRLSIINTQDVRNISSSYAVNLNVQRNVNDFLSVDMWVKEMLELEHSPVLLYKVAGKIDNKFPQLDEDDFLLCFMNEAQEEIFKIYGSDVVSIDSTHGTNKYNVQLSSIIVKDDNWEGFPVAFMWSNRQTEYTFRYFFTALKERIDIHPRTFMSDDFPAFYNAWSSVFGTCQFHLICDWHVKRAWTKNISTGSNQIKDIEKRKAVLNALFVMASETDKVSFHNLLEQMCQQLLSDPESLNFGLYLSTTYKNRVEQWAASYRLGANINTNMSVERWHRELKYNSDLQGKCGGRLDKAIHSLLKSLKLKLLDRLCSLARGKLTKKLTLLRKAHDLAKENFDGDIFNESENMWVVPSFTNFGKLYCVTKISIDSVHSCNITCSLCNICIHQLRCSCPESAIKYNFCKHMHIVGMKCRLPDESMPNEDSTDVLCASTQEEKEKNYILQELNKERSRNVKEDAKSAVLSLFSEIENYSEEQCKEVIKNMKIIKHKCDVIGGGAKQSLPVVSINAHNKKIQPQRKCH